MCCTPFLLAGHRNSRLRWQDACPQGCMLWAAARWVFAPSQAGKNKFMLCFGFYTNTPLTHSDSVQSNITAFPGMREGRGAHSSTRVGSPPCAERPLMEAPLAQCCHIKNLKICTKSCSWLVFPCKRCSQPPAPDCSISTRIPASAAAPSPAPCAQPPLWL